MKKIYIITIIISIIVTFLICFLITNDTETSNVKDITMSDYDYICSYETNMSDEDGETNTKIEKKLYLKVDNDSLVTDALYESIYENSYFRDSTRDLINELLSLYDDIKGVNTSIKDSKKKTHVSIHYNYNAIDFTELKNKLSNILDKDSLQANLKSKIKVDEYINKSNDYKCQKK